MFLKISSNTGTRNAMSVYNSWCAGVGFELFPKVALNQHYTVTCTVEH